MNVTENGYYTSTYLDTVNKPKQKRHSEKIRRRDNPVVKHPKISQSVNLSPKTIRSKPDTVISTSRTSTYNQSPSMNYYPRDIELSNVMPISPESDKTFTTDNDTINTDDVSFDPDQPYQQITPAQLNFLQKAAAHPKKNSRRRSVESDLVDLHSDGYSYDDSTYDDDSYYKNRQQYRYDEYYDGRHRVRVPKKLSHKTVQKKPSKSVRFEGFYKDQKKRYDEAEYKPTIYSHPLLNKVFEDNEADDNNLYNPIDSLFEDPQEAKELEERQKLKLALKTFREKVGGNEYKNYNYYDQLNKPPSKEVLEKVFETNQEDDDSEDENIGEVEPEEAKEEKKKKSFKKRWKVRTKKFKKELGRDYFENLVNQLEEEEKQKELKSKKIEELPEDETVNEAIIEEPDDVPPSPKDASAPGGQFFAGPKPEFHPAWNYILSWLTYQQPESAPVEAVADSEEAGSVVSLTPPASTKAPSVASSKASSKPPVVKPKKQNPYKNVKNLKGTTDQLKNINKNLVKIKNMWNLPASNLFNAERDHLPPSNRSIKSKEISLRSYEPSVISLPQSSNYTMMSVPDADEIEIELSDEDAEPPQIYFNPQTGGFDIEPPTSWDAMSQRSLGRSLGQSLGSSNNGFRNKVFIDTSKGATAIISNINNLIKSIRLMKIIFAPIDVIAESFPHLQTVVIMVELVIFMWMLYELSLLIDALCMMVKAICAPMIAMGRFMNRIM